MKSTRSILSKLMLKLNPSSPLILPCKFSRLISIQFLKKLVEREFDGRSRHFPLDDHFMNSYHFPFNLCIDYLIIREKFMWVTHGPKGLIIIILKRH